MREKNEIKNIYDKNTKRFSDQSVVMIVSNKAKKESKKKGKGKV